MKITVEFSCTRTKLLLLINIYTVLLVGVWFYVTVYSDILTTRADISNGLCQKQLCLGSRLIREKTRVKQLTIKRTTHHKLALLVPYRDCWSTLQRFAPFMKKYLDRKRIPFQIYVLNQVDYYRFNRGALLNVGFMESDPDCDYIAMHDVDLLPLSRDLNYSYPDKGPYHACSPALHPSGNKFDRYFGGILLMTKSHFKKINGLSINFWGWGGEDDQLRNRVEQMELKVFTPQGLKTGPNNTFLHIHEADRARDKRRYFNQTKIKKDNDTATGLNTTLYTIQSRYVKVVHGTPVTFLNILLECNREETPFCVPIIATNKSATRQSLARNRSIAMKLKQLELANKTKVTNNTSNL